MSMTLVSKRAGVSVATVSRVVNGNRWVSSETVAAVQSAMRDVGYTPPVPRTRKAKRGTPSGTGCMALVFPDTAAAAMRTALSGRITHGISSVLAKHHIQLTVTGLLEPEHLPPTVEPRRVDGIFIRGTVPIEKLLEEAGALPTVCVFETPTLPSRVDQVMEDNCAIGELAASYLLGRNHRHLGLINFVSNHPSYRPRGRSFVDSVEQAGCSVTNFSVNVTPEEVRSACATLTRQILNANPRPTALFVAGTDQHGGLLIQAMRKERVRVPEEMDFICCRYDLSSLSLLDPHVVTIDIQAEAVGALAAETMLWRIENSDAPRRRILVAPKLIPATQ